MLDMIPMIKKTDIVNAIEKDETKDSTESNFINTEVRFLNPDEFYFR